MKMDKKEVIYPLKWIKNTKKAFKTTKMDKNKLIYPLKWINLKRQLYIIYIKLK